MDKNELCGKDLGGIWLPDRAGIEVFVPVWCNRDLNHTGFCLYRDVKSGNLITRASSPTVDVDARGCVKTELNQPTELIKKLERKELGVLKPDQELMVREPTSYSLFELLFGVSEKKENEVVNSIAQLFKNLRRETVATRVLAETKMLNPVLKLNSAMNYDVVAAEIRDRESADKLSPELMCAIERSGTRDTLNTRAIAKHQAQRCACYRVDL